MKSLAKRLQPLIGFVVSALLIYIVLFRPQFGALFSGRMGIIDALFGSPRLGINDLITAFDLLRFGPAALALTILVGSLFVRAWRWKLIIAQVGDARYWTVFHSLNTGYLLNNVLPLRAGELLRGVVVARRSNLPIAALLTTVIVERIFDLAGLAVIFGLVMLAFPFPGWLQAAGGTIAVVIIGLLIVGFILSGSTERLARWHDKANSSGSAFLAKMAEQVIHLIKGLGVLRSKKSMLHMVWTTLTLWAMYIAVMKYVLDAFQITDGRYPLLAGAAWIQSTAMTVITALGFSIPSAPGGIGTYHASVLLGLSWFEVPEGLGVVFAATMHAVNYITMTLAGLVGLWRLKLSWADVIKITREKDTVEAMEVNELDPATEPEQSGTTD